MDEMDVKATIKRLIDQTGSLVTFVRHSFSSLFSAGVDYTVFAVAYWLSEEVFLSIFCARAVSVTANFLLEKVFVFHSKRRTVHTLPQYLLLVLVSGSLAGLLIEWLAPLLGGRVILAKAMAEGALFFTNYLIQRYIIFKT
jgi:putative flippase GtrA